MSGIVPVRDCRTPQEAVDQFERAKAFRRALLSAREPEAEPKRVRVIPLPRPTWAKMPLPSATAKRKPGKVRFRPEEELTPNEIAAQRAEALVMRRSLWEQRHRISANDWIYLVLLRVYCRTGHTPNEITSTARFKPLVRSRKLAARVARHIKFLRHVSTVQLSEFFGGRDHSVMHHYCAGTAAAKFTSIDVRRVPVDVRQAVRRIGQGASLTVLSEEQRTTWSTVRKRMLRARSETGPDSLEAICEEMGVGFRMVVTLLDRKQP